MAEMMKICNDENHKPVSNFLNVYGLFTCCTIVIIVERLKATNFFNIVFRFKTRNIDFYNITFFLYYFCNPVFRVFVYFILIICANLVV